MIFVLIFVPLGGPSAASASHSPKLPELRSLPAALALSISPVSQSFSTDSRELLTPSSKVNCFSSLSFLPPPNSVQST